MPNINQQIRVMQIVAGALIMGVVMFGAVAAVVVGGDHADDPGLLTWIAVGFGVNQLVLRTIIPTAIAKSSVQKIAGELQDDDVSRNRLVGIYQTQMIIGMALLEGGAFLGLVAYIAQKHVFALGVAGVLAAVMAATFPARMRVEGWMRRQLDMAEFN